MSVILVTIDTPTGPLDLSVPARLVGSELLAMLAPTSESSWQLSMSDGTTAIGHDQTLADAGVLDGTVLHLEPVGRADHRSAKPSAPPVTPDPATCVLPVRISTGQRARIVIGALIGAHASKEVRDPLDRALHAWTWTDHARRLEWLASRPRLLRTVTIGVVGHRSAEVATSLSATLERVRHDRVVLIAERAPFHHTHNGSTARPSLEAIETELRRADTTRRERDALFSRTAGGTLLVPLDRSMAPDIATFNRFLDSLTAHAGIVIVDCGAPTAPDPDTARCYDQVIHSSTGIARTMPVPTIVASWGDAMPEQSLDRAARIGMDDDPASILELAVVVVAGWAQLGAATSMPLGV